MARQVVAYIRRSKVEAASPGDISRDTQLAAIRARAAIDGHNGDMVVLEDWGRSGRRAKVAQREAYARLRAMVAEDQVDAIYAYNWSRLGRSTRDLLELADLCREHGTAIITATGQSVDPSTADGRMLLTILTAVDEWQAEVQAERTAGVLAAWREAHPDEKLGRRPYGDHDGESVAAVLAAFEEAGSFLGAAKLLNARRVPTRLGNRMGWSVRTVARIVRRERPDLVPMGERRGQRTIGRRLFAGLLVCSCGDVLTSMPRAGSVGYYCRRAHNDATHPRPYVVSEKRLLPFAMAELAHLIPLTASQGTASGKERAELQRQRQSVVEYGLANLLPAEETARRVAEIDAALGKLDARERVIVVPPIDWTRDAAANNTAIRGLIERIKLGPDMLPLPAPDGFVWRFPELRAERERGRPPRGSAGGRSPQGGASGAHEAAADTRP